MSSLVHEHRIYCPNLLFIGSSIVLTMNQSYCIILLNIILAVIHLAVLIFCPYSDVYVRIEIQKQLTSQSYTAHPHVFLGVQVLGIRCILLKLVSEKALH